MVFERAIEGNGWTVEIIKDAGVYRAIKGYQDSDGFNAVRALGTYKTLAGAERAARKAVA